MRQNDAARFADIDRAAPDGAGPVIARGAGEGGGPQAAPTAQAGPSGDPYIDGLLYTEQWDTLNLTFQFPQTGGFYGVSYGDGQNVDEFRPLSADQAEAFRDVLDMYQAVSGLVFTEVSGSDPLVEGDIRAAVSGGPDTAEAYLPAPVPEGGDVWFGVGTTNTPEPGTYGFLTFLHEAGHALGLSHSFEAAGPFPAMPADRDALEYTVMSYSSYVGQTEDGGYVNVYGAYPQSLMMYDIAAIQHLYGANFNYNDGDTVYSFDALTGQFFINGAGQGAPAANYVFRTIWDGGGVDTYDLSNYFNDMDVNLNPGASSLFSLDQLADLNAFGSQTAEGNLYNALMHHGSFDSLIENVVTGGGDDAIRGNQTANQISGRAGNDDIHGGGSPDYLLGQGGDDTVRGGGGDDLLFGLGGGDTLSGGEGRDTMYGGDRDDTLSGENGADFLFGDAGRDTISGGDGDDIMFGGAGGDTLRGEGGINRGRGEDGGDALIGGNALDILFGGAGDDILNGRGGRDILAGDEGADMFVYRAADESMSGADARDSILDFSSAEGDLIDLSAIDADATAPGDQSFSLVSSFSGRAGELLVLEARAADDVWLVRADLDGDARYDLDILVSAAEGPVESDFIL